MSTEKTSEYTKLEIYLFDDGININVDIAKDDGPESIAAIFLAIQYDHILSRIGELMTAKILETKGKAFAAQFLSIINNKIETNSSVVRPTEVMSRINRASI